MEKTLLERAKEVKPKYYRVYDLPKGEQAESLVVDYLKGNITSNQVSKTLNLPAGTSASLYCWVVGRMKDAFKNGTLIYSPKNQMKGRK